MERMDSSEDMHATASSSSERFSALSRGPIEAHMHAIVLPGAA
jgi:hypothetical protein